MVNHSSLFRTAGAAAAAVLVVLAARCAHAEDGSASPAPRPAASKAEAPSRWYGWQTLSADGGAALFVVASVSVGQRQGSPSGELAFAALGTYALGGPIIHLVHHNYGRSAASLGLRVGGPIVLAATGAALACGDSHGEFCGLGAGLLGATLGIIGAITVDAAVFAYDDEPELDARSTRLQLAFSPAGLSAFGTF